MQNLAISDLFILSKCSWLFHLLLNGFVLLSIVNDLVEQPVNYEQFVVIHISKATKFKHSI